jgi:hypothetical protein
MRSRTNYKSLAEEGPSQEAIEDLALRIASYVTEQEMASWAMLVEQFPELSGGNYLLEAREPEFSNVVVWKGLSLLGISAFQHAVSAGLIKLKTIEDLREVPLMGGGLALPIANRIRHFKKSRWVPTWIVPA